MDNKPTQSPVLTDKSSDFRIPLNAISVPTLVLSPDFLMVDANEARLRVTMTKREDIIGRPLFDAFPDNPNDKAAEGVRNLRASLERVLRDKIPDKMAIQKYDIPKPDTDPVEFEVRFWSPINIPILGVEGEVTHILHQVEDVTEAVLGQDRLKMMTSEIYARTNEVRSANSALKIAKEGLEIKVEQRTSALAASERRFRVIANALPQIVWTAAVTGTINWYNDWWYEFTGNTSSQQSGDDHHILVHPDDLDSRERKWKQSVATGETFQAEFRLKRKSDGHYRWHLGRAVPVRDGQGQIDHWVGSETDIHDQKVMQERIAANEAQFRELADAMPQLVIVSSAEGEVIYTNQRAQNYFGKPERNIEGWQLRPENFFHPDDKKRAVDSWRESVRTGKLHEIEYRIRRYDGEYRWHLGRAVPVRNENGQITKWYATNTDIHEQKLLAEQLNDARQAAESANATKSAFLANMSHEIRTPLAAIIGFSELLREPGLSGEAKEQYLGTVIRSGHGLTRIIDDILDLAKVEAGKLEIEEIEFSVAEFVQEVLDLFRDKCRHKGIYLDLNMEEEVPKHVISDPTRIRQILVNLIGNALKFTTKGGVRVNLKSVLHERGGVDLIFCVKDTGIGMTESQVEKLFQPFVQADNSTTREYGGTGLGLVLSRRLANALGGNITISECEEGRGCTFTVSVRAALPQEAKRSESSRGTDTATGASAPLQSFRLSHIKVLLADDSADNQFLVARVLKKHGASVELANDGEEAIRKALDSEFDLILMDIQMPRVNGYEATRALRLNGFQKPIIALTAHAMAEERARTHDAGCSGHLTKPINQMELIETIEQQVSHVRSQAGTESQLQ